METDEDIRVIVGLGNPGPKYERTRHNVGFLVLEALAGPGASWQQSDSGVRATVRVGRSEKILFRPLTFMNRSGRAVAQLLAREELRSDQILVVYDDIDLEASRIRIRRSGGAGTHRGVASILAELETGDFPRVRVGVGGPPLGMPLDRYVLELLEGAAWDAFSKVVARAADAIRVICDEGIGVGMNQFNPMPPLDSAVGRSREGESDSDSGGKN